MKKKLTLDHLKINSFVTKDDHKGGLDPLTWWSQDVVCETKAYLCNLTGLILC